MKIDVVDDNIDVSSGGEFRRIMENIFGNEWANYKTVYLVSKTKVPLVPNDIVLSEPEGPAAITYDGKFEYWFMGNKLPCTTPKEFESYKKMKAFW